jgi:uncharacterized protein DUF6894
MDCRSGGFAMPLYRFRIVPDEPGDDVVLSFPDDHAALEQAGATLRDLLVEAAQRGRTTHKDVQVKRVDGSLVGTASAKEE